MKILVTGGAGFKKRNVSKLRKTVKLQEKLNCQQYQ